MKKQKKIKVTALIDPILLGTAMGLSKSETRTNALTTALVYYVKHHGRLKRDRDQLKKITELSNKVKEKPLAMSNYVPRGRTIESLENS